MKESEVHTKAARILRGLGWAQGDYVNAEGGVCLGEALTRAAYGTDIEYVPQLGIDEFDKAWRRIERLTGTGNGSIPAWNDALGRTLDEVVNVLDKAAEEARAEGR